MIDHTTTRETVRFFAYACTNLIKVDPSARVLDFGCGRGELVQQLRERGYDAYGCDPEADWTPEPHTS